MIETLIAYAAICYAAAGCMAWRWSIKPNLKQELLTAPLWVPFIMPLMAIDFYFRRYKPGDQ